MKNTTIRRLLGGLAVLVLGSSLASASTITWYNNIFSPASGSASNSNPGAPTAFATPWSATVDIPKYDTNLGALNSVTVVLNWIENGSLFVINFGGSPASFTNGHITAPLSVTDGFTTVNAAALAGSVSDTLGAGSSNTYTGLSGSGSATGFASPLNLAFYGSPGGVGSITFNFTSGSSTAGVDGCATCASAATLNNTGAQLVVTYTYGVPEPGTFVILGTGLAGIGLALRKRNKA